MKRRIALCIVAVAGLFPACARAIEAADDAGPVYVSEKDGAACLELGPAGVFYLRSAPGEYSGGPWESRRKEVTMLPHAGSQVTMTRDGEALVDAAGTRWLKDTHAAAPKNDTARPVYVTVRDFDTGRAVTEFSYDYWIDTEAGRETTRWARRRNVRAADGSVTIDAPPDCDVTVCVESPDYISGFGNWGIFTVESTDDSRSFVIELRRGAVVRGTVTDGADGKPLENSRVSAIVSPTIGVSGPDLVRGVLTDGKGEFVLRGVDPELGINVHHPAYVEFDGMRITDHAGRTERQEVSVKVALEKGARINGTVLDAGQDPIEGVMVGGVGMKSVMTGRDGSFSIVSPDKPGVGGVISFTKAGYRGRRLPVPLDTPVVILENEVRTELGGKVTGPDGAPVGRFEIVLGPGNDPEVWQCKRTEIINSNGVFRLDTPFNDRNWVAIRADGFAPWDSGIEPGRDAGGRTISLSKGVAVRGRIVLRGGPALAGAELVLIPSRWMIKAGIRSLSIGEAFLAHETTGRPDGSFLIENVNPGEYVLSVTSDTASPCEYWLSVPKDGIEVGTITLDGL
ncbi:MAG: carboxypeptidase-like regulatory domain-containing protein, partial [bacterium]